MAAPCVAVAWSGGRDSTALLHATLAQARNLGLRVLALHVHHGLSPHADAWWNHCESQARVWAGEGEPVEFVGVRLAGRPRAAQSVEAWARRERYKALRQMALAHGASVVLLGHHRRDQAETFLLQALRGAGVAGLSGMPREAMRDGVRWLRPFLDQPREAVESYVGVHRLSFIEDDSNEDDRFARNRLRHVVWPGMVAAFAHAEVSLAASAGWCQEATAALGELADIDLAMASHAKGLDVDAWLTLSPARRSNALRAWLKLQAGHASDAGLVSRLMAELPVCRSAQWIVAGGELRTHKGVLVRRSMATAGAAPASFEATLCIRRAGVYALPGWGGRLKVERVAEGGVPLAWLAQLELRGRAGAERFQAGIGRPPRSLKRQFQAAGLAQWERDGPLVYSGDQLVFVPGLGIDARMIGMPGQPLVQLIWMRSAADA